MNQNKSVSTFLVITAIYLYACSAHASTDWFVRPFNGGNYGVADGSSYTSAWDGLGSVVWDASGANGVAPGDTLWVCETHGDAGTNYVGAHTTLVVGLSGTGDSDTQRITIRGDCSTLDTAYDDGTIYRIARRYTSGWFNTGSNGVYTHSNFGSIAQLYENLVLLENEAPDTSGMGSWPSGAWFYDQANVMGNPSPTIYLKPLSGSDPNQLVYATMSGDKTINIDGKDYITVKNLAMYGSSTSNGTVYLNASHHINLENLFLSDCYICVTSFGSDNGKLLNSLLTRTAQGILFNTSGGVWSNDWIVRNNEISVVSRHPRFTNYPDGEAIGIQDGTNNLFEYNNIHTVAGAGFVLYMTSTGVLSNTIVRYNRVHDVTDALGLGGHRETGIDFHTHNINYVPDNNANNEIYSNIISNVVATEPSNYKGSALFNVGSRPSNGEPWKIYNNTALNSTRCLTTFDLATGDNAIIFSNNMCINTIEHHIQYGSSNGEPQSLMQIDNNLYYPDGPSMFNWDGALYDFNGLIVNAGKESSSPTPAAPLFVDPSNPDPDLRDFHLTAGSPAINTGVDMGLTMDYDGNPIINTPDIGAYEYDYADTDGDGLSDYEEQCHDGDCIDYDPYDPVTNPNGGDTDVTRQDTDMDGYTDEEEVRYGSDPVNSGDIPNITPDGDVNIDGVVNVADVLLSQRYVLGLAILSQTQIDHGDFRPIPDGDSDITVADLLIILQTAFSQ